MSVQRRLVTDSQQRSKDSLLGSRGDGSMDRSDPIVEIGSSGARDSQPAIKIRDDQVIDDESTNTKLVKASIKTIKTPKAQYPICALASSIDSSFDSGGRGKRLESSVEGKGKNWDSEVRRSMKTKSIKKKQ